MSQDKQYHNLYQHLVHNEKPVRQAAMRKLRAFISAKAEMDDQDMLKIWRGLYYCFWMSDKTEIQNEFACNLAANIHLWDAEKALLYFYAAMKTLSDQWSTIDHHRMNKYLTLMRRLLEAIFIYMRCTQWDDGVVQGFVAIMSDLLRQTNGLQRGAVLHIVEIYIHSFAKSFLQDVFFNELDIDQRMKDDEYDNTMSLEDVFYQQLVHKRSKRFGKEALARYHAKRAAKLVGAAPLAYEHTKEGQRAAALAAGKPKNPLTGKYIHTNPIAYLMHKKTKNIKMEDTPDVDPDLVTISQTYIDAPPQHVVIDLLDLLFNCYKLSTSDAALAEVLTDHCDKALIKIASRFAKDAKCQLDNVDNDDDEIVLDALQPVIVPYLKAIQEYVFEKGADSEIMDQTQTGLRVDEMGNVIEMSNNQKKKLKKKQNIARLSLQELPVTPKIRKTYYSLSHKLEMQIKALDELGIDWDSLGQDGEGEEGDEEEMYRQLMMLNGEGELDPSMFGEGEEGDMFPEFGEGEEGEDDLFDGEGEIDPSFFMDGEGELDEDMLEFFNSEMMDDEEGQPPAVKVKKIGDTRKTPFLETDSPQDIAEPDQDEDEDDFDFGEGEDFDFGEGELFFDEDGNLIDPALLYAMQHGEEGELDLPPGLDASMGGLNLPSDEEEEFDPALFNQWAEGEYEGEFDPSMFQFFGEGEEGEDWMDEDDEMEDEMIFDPALLKSLKLSDVLGEQANDKKFVKALFDTLAKAVDLQVSFNKKGEPILTDEAKIALLKFGDAAIKHTNMQLQIQEGVGEEAGSNAKKNQALAKSYVSHMSAKDMQTYGFGDQKIPLTQQKEQDAKNNKRKQPDAIPTPSKGKKVEDDVITKAGKKQKSDATATTTAADNRLVQLDNKSKKSVSLALNDTQTKQFFKDQPPLATTPETKSTKQQKQQEAPQQQQPKQQQQQNKKQTPPPAPAPTPAPTKANKRK